MPPYACARPGLILSFMKKYNQKISSGIRCASTNVNLPLSGKIAVVTCSTDGIGYATVKRMAKEGAKVMLSSRNKANVMSAVKSLQKLGLDVEGEVCHVSNQEQRDNLMKKTVEKYGGIDILVANAGVNPAREGLLECSETVIDKIFEVNVKNALQLTQAAAPHLRDRPGASVIFMSTISAYFPYAATQSPFLGGYAVSKAAVLALTRALSVELAPDIRVNCVAPGLCNTKFGSKLTDNPVAKKIITEGIPMGRFGETDEIAGVISFLASPSASYITGETIVAAGGMGSRL